MKVLLVASECAPFIKTGGLADVVGALPKALDPLGVSSRVILPLYPALKNLAEKASVVEDLGSLFGSPARLMAVDAEGLSLFLLDAPGLFDRTGSIYLDQNGKDWSDNAQRYAALCEAATRVAVKGFDGWQPDLVHAHDWQAGLTPWYLRQAGADIPSVLTIHNIAFQGLFPASLSKELRLDPAGFSPEGYEYYDQISYLKAGIVASEKITTVSPTYARELMSPEFGMGFEGLLQSRKSDLAGILNGIDLDTWDPQTDAAIESNYSSKALKQKALNRTALEERFNLTANPAAPLFCVISRLTAQKGLDMLLEVLPVLVGRGGRLALLGSGDAALEDAFRKAASDHAGSVGTIIGYDESLSHLMQAGADAILIPSRFEPCGLTQLYGLRYGTLPVVARTGGLADTVIDANDAAMRTGCATGFQFAPVSAAGLADAIDRACDLFADQKGWTSLISNAMRHQVGWDASAAAYRALFDTVLSAGKKEAE
ncbi:glycogen synthase GlgA [Roseibium sp. MMSF_3544]|uniref:glycogen synthase GlgA n=1 Tax=unclassified Roseibium TaxID=2629323 RepID=UPI00273E8B38|nr:glycogen synthase GlgA [Roseibium sp. MMSF_3544]